MLRLFLFIAVCLPLMTAPAQAAGEPAAAISPSVTKVQVGFGNRYKLGCWTPVAITLDSKNNSSTAARSGAANRIDVEAVDGDGVPVWFVGPNISATESSVHMAYVRIGRAGQSMQFRLTKTDEKNAASSEPLTVPHPDNSLVALPATNQFILELGASIGLPEISRRLNQNDAEGAAVVTLDRQQPLPDRWYGYDGVDTVAIAGKAVDQAALTGPASDALENWVRQGGQLLVCSGDGATQLLGANGPLARFAPGELAGNVNLPAARFGTIENFADAEQRLEATSIRVPQWKNLGPDRRIELSGGGRTDDLPLVVRWPLGFGQVIFVGLDLDQPPFKDWPSRGKFLERLLGRSKALAAQSSHASRQGKQLGYIDLSGQLRGALDRFRDVQLIPFWIVAALVILYIALLFPLNYLIAVRWLHRPRLAWILFPGVLVLFCTAALALANHAKGDLEHVNHVDLVDIDMSAGQARGTTWFNIFSPVNALHDLSVQPISKEKNSSSLLSWFGLPGTGLGGMSSAAVNPPLFDEPYTIDPSQGTVSGVPLAKWSTQSFVARWNASSTALVGGQLEASLTATPDRRLRGTLTNRSALPLLDCILLFDRWAFPIGELGPGKSVALDRIESQTIDTYLTKRRTIAAHDEIPPYDRAGFDVHRIMEVMMFYDAAGGSNYTGLLNRYQRFTDLTSQLEFGRAILVGRGPYAAAINIDEKSAPTEAASDNSAVYRFVLQVKLPGEG